MAGSYDDFAQKWLEQKKSGTNYVHDYLEKPAMMAKLPDLSGKRVLCLGCGTGDECAELLARGAVSIVGIDNSEAMLALAREAYKGDPRVEFIAMDITQLNFPDASFDFVYSSLTMHYAKDWLSILRVLKRITTPGAPFLFSAHHPLTWGGEITRGTSEDSMIMGYRRPKDKSQPATVYGDYLNTHKTKDVWFGGLEVEFYHKPLADILREIRESGYVIADFIEPKPLAEAQALDARFYAICSRIPRFMIFELK